ncbi:hypothetical protein TPHA_0A01270 [Tetrapisispora phaffii CBS 4417]|uniref:Dolichol-phosphate mannosyltransferase subunit 3 n=1 Tax=Tetrapisispora phaffii (strain ATCC 24235 / CBS 4417 / NBRC 1672 / NRRL Y-8282 / UCD 70-5) TaxID=1071381 RepID=G8BMT3_TETPH|nr:hypothetical protein TPHA_0A01270 [Tetrapisispora phaffii CBS 4417]CCE61211.1 hypothetical protein TPHA_0A01270 [Tetrapisispora phaffii CBS 4417]
MNQKLLGCLVLLGTYSIVTLALYSFKFALVNETISYYWSAVLLLPVILWLWALVAWCEAEMLSNAKREW